MNAIAVRLRRLVRRGGPAGAIPEEAVAATLERLAMLLAGGAAVPAAWRLLATHGDGSGETATLHEVAVGVAGGGDSADVLRGHSVDAWRALGCAFALAGRTGAPLAQGLSGLAAGFRDVGAARRDIEVALTGPASTSRIVLALPAVGLLLGLVMGVDTLGVLTTTPAGWSCLASGAALMLVAWRWSRALVARASRGDPHPGLALDLVAMGMRGGGAASQVVEAVRVSLREFRLHDAALARVTGILALADDGGVPPAELLRREAALVRLLARSEAQRSAARLGVTLMLPLGVCVLPAFVALGVAPLVLAILGDVLRPLAQG